MYYTDANELIERVLDGEEPEEVLDSIDEDMYIADLLAVEYLNPYLQEWATIDEIDEELLGEIDEWDYRESDLDEDEFLEKSGTLKKALKIGAGVAGAAGAAALYAKKKKSVGGGMGHGQFIKHAAKSYKGAAGVGMQKLGKRLVKGKQKKA